MLGTFGDPNQPATFLDPFVSGPGAFGRVLGANAPSDPTDIPFGSGSADFLTLLNVDKRFFVIDTVSELKGRGYGDRVERSSGQPSVIFTYNPLASEEQVLMFLDSLREESRCRLQSAHWVFCFGEMA